MTPFLPDKAVTVTVSATTSSSRGAITFAGSKATFPQARVYNAGSVAVFVEFGSSTVAATTADMPIAPGAVEVFTLEDGDTHMAAITASSSASVYVTAGRGV